MSGDDEVGPADLRRAIDVREGLRALLLHNNGHALDEERVARLDRAVRPRRRAGSLRGWSRPRARARRRGRRRRASRA